MKSESKLYPVNRKTLVASISTAAVITCLVGIWQRAVPTPEERKAMDILPGYSFVFEGRTNVIRRVSGIRAFRRQHPMMPYLNLTAEIFRTYNWPMEFPIRIKETETQVILTWPGQIELLGLEICWGSAYRVEIVIDKKTMKIISALSG